MAIMSHHAAIHLLVSQRLIDTPSRLTVRDQPHETAEVADISLRPALEQRSCQLVVGNNREANTGRHFSRLRRI